MATILFPADLPLPGNGNTAQRWAAFGRLASRDLVAVRLAEGDADARAILAELHGPRPEPGRQWAVWAARPPSQRVSAQAAGWQWRLSGRMPYCSGATSADHALVVADAEDGVRLFAVDLSQAAVRPVPGTWKAVGMAASDSLDVVFDEAVATVVGGPGSYVGRPGFWYGGMGVAACWYGGAVGVARTLADAAQDRDLDPQALAHLGRIDVLLAAGQAMLDEAAARVDADPADLRDTASLRAQRLRAFVADLADEVVDRVGRALGAGPLCQDTAHARQVSDLTVYVRQHHAERDLEAIGRDLAKNGSSW
ncbi:acyl-CoA dehydrogenase family protein [Acidothermaceae bacterium B102]|nr:acyl-CoA dehydrogenase family protein [Acidothermaceae bacterium B102]